MKRVLGPPQNIEKRKSYRYVLPTDMAARLELSFGIGERVPLNILNLNEVAVAAEYDPTEFAIPFDEDQPYQLHLRINGESFEIKGELLRYAEGYVVFRFASLSADQFQRLTAFFPVILGKSLQEKPVPREHSVWYHGSNNTDLFIKRDSETNKIVSLTFISENYYFYWNDHGEAKTGKVLRSTYAEGLDFSKREANPVELDATPNSETLLRMSLIIENASLSSANKKEISGILEACR